MLRSDFKYDIRIISDSHNEIDIWFHDILIIDCACSFVEILNRDIEEHIKKLMKTPNEKMLKILFDQRKNKLERIIEEFKLN